MIPCIIPARGGSKGIPRKNLLPVGGKPLIVWSIEQALASSLVDQVIVATDDDEIAYVATHTGYLGVTVFRRSAESATDDAPTETVLAEVIEALHPDAEAVVMLQATSPIRQECYIDSAIKLFRYTQADSMFSARRLEGYTWDGLTSELLDGPRRPRQLEDRCTLEENGSIYIFKPSVLREHGSRLGGRIVPYVMHPFDSFQIDGPYDVPMIESLLEIRCGSCTAATY